MPIKFIGNFFGGFMPDTEYRQELNVNIPEKKGRMTNFIIIPLIMILLFMLFMVYYTTNLLYKADVSDIHEVGEDRIHNVSSRLENYLDNARSILWVTAESVDYMTYRHILKWYLLRMKKVQRNIFLIIRLI